MEQRLTDRGDAEELIKTNVGGVHLMDREQRPSQVSLYYVIWALPCGKIPSSERIDAHSWNKVYQTEMIEIKVWGVHSTDS